MTEGPELSESGSPIYRYQERRIPYQRPVEPECLEAIGDHIEEHLGTIDTVFHEVVSDLVHIDLHHVPPTPERNFHTLVTSGMSDSPMSAPEGMEACRYAELLACLPPEWPVEYEAFQDEGSYWPLRWLKFLARFPHEYDTWLWEGHTVPNGDPPEPFAPGTRFCCMMLAPPLLAPPEFQELRIAEGKTICFFALIPLYREEMEFKLKRGLEELLGKLDRRGVTELIDPNRRNLCKRRRWPF